MTGCDIDWSFGMQVVTSSFVEPLIFGKRLHLHPIFVLFSLVFWNMLWGLTGAVLSIPIMCALKIILLNMPNRAFQAALP